MFWNKSDKFKMYYIVLYFKQIMYYIGTIFFLENL
jgi:hypothetical protein